MISSLSYHLKTLSLCVVNELDELWQTTDMHGLTNCLETVFCFCAVLKYCIGFVARRALLLASAMVLFKTVEIAKTIFHCCFASPQGSFLMPVITS